MRHTAGILALVLMALTLGILGGCSRIQVNRTACREPDPNGAPTTEQYAFYADGELNQASLAIYNQSNSDVLVYLRHETHDTYEMRTTVQPRQTAYFVVPAGVYRGVENISRSRRRTGTMTLRKGRCHEWLVGEEPR